MPYLQHVKNVAKDWPHLRELADFMQVSTSPLKWKFLDSCDIQERAARTRVSMLMFYNDRETSRRDFTRSNELVDALQGIVKEEHDFEARLFVVEDLSRDVIEALGSSFDIDPLFFRNQLADHIWYNIIDPWVEMPDLEMFAKKRNFFHMRYIQTGYFKNQESFDRAREEAGTFNVFRRPDNDYNHKKFFDGPNAMVARTRSRVSFWYDRTSRGRSGVTGKVTSLFRDKLNTADSTQAFCWSIRPSEKATRYGWATATLTTRFPCTVMILHMVHPGHRSLTTSRTGLKR